MNPIYKRDGVTLYLSDCLSGLRALPEKSVDAVVTDPPYELGFMGKSWDASGIAYSVELWREVLRVLKPGAHLLAFGGTRTYHRMACAIEDAGFEVRDQMQWIYGQGFPKSLDVAKAIDKQGGHWRVRANGLQSENGAMSGANYLRTDKGEPITDEAQQWQGWGTALKPANEPICVARKRLAEKTVAANVLKHGTGALNIDAGRIQGAVKGWAEPRGGICLPDAAARADLVERDGRFPSNVILDEEAAAMLDSGASRFFYCAKASRSERNAGCEDLAARQGRTCYDPQYHEGGGKLPARSGNHHPTVKPVKLMRYLVRLVTPPDGTVLDIFTGSGTTGVAAVNEGFNFIGIEREAEYFEIACRRIEAAQPLTSAEAAA